MSPYTLSRRQAFEPSCPLGGQWYVCEAASKFVGCCNNEPCTLGCKQGDLMPASFKAEYHGTFPDFECNSGRPWTCNFTSPPFMGCCKINPCRNQGCPTEDLAPGYLNEATACQFLARGCPSASSSATASSSTTDSTSSSTNSSGSSATTPEATASRKSSTGPIVGGAIGGVAGFVIVAFMLFYCCRHAAKSRKAWNNRGDAHNNQQDVKSESGVTEDSSKAGTHYQGLSMSFLVDHFSYNKR